MRLLLALRAFAALDDNLGVSLPVQPPTADMREDTNLSRLLLGRLLLGLLLRLLLKLGRVGLELLLLLERERSNT